MIPKTIHQIWLGPNLIPERFSCFINQMGQVNKNWNQILWNEESLGSIGIRVNDLFFQSGGCYAGASNVARLMLLRRFGGMYLDVDCEPIQPMDSLVVHSAVAAIQDGNRICNAVMGAEPNHPWIQWQLDHLNDYKMQDAASGVYLATDAPRDLVTVVPTHVFYPWHYEDPPENRYIRRDTMIAHHWDGSWLTKKE